MTLKEFINEATQIAKELQAKGDHAGFQKVMVIIAGAIYEEQTF